MPKAKKVEAPSPLIPHHWEPADAGAFQQLQRGEASPAQQQRALAWLLECTGLKDEPYRPGGTEGDRDTAFACGKRNIGLQVAKLLTINISAFTKKETEPHDGRKP
jgi:hypothetical protein